MRSKTYATEIVNKAVKKLADAPALEPRYIDHVHALETLSKEILDLYTKKNYDIKQIVAMLKESGIKTTMKEVKTLIQSKKVVLPKKA